MSSTMLSIIYTIDMLLNIYHLFVPWLVIQQSDQSTIRISHRLMFDHIYGPSFQEQPVYGHISYISHYVKGFFEISDKEIETIREGFIKWVQEYKDIYYQHDATQLSTCPVTIHALLHIVDSIKFMGPVWCYWAFPMERYCNRLKPAICSHCFPFAALDQYVLEDAQLTQIKSFYNLSKELALCVPRNTIPQGSFSHEAYPSCILLPPHNPQHAIEVGVLKSIAAALSTRFHIPVTAIQKLLQDVVIEGWGKVHRVDSDEGDTIQTSSLGRRSTDKWDATFIWYEMLVDKHAKVRRHKPVFIRKTFYG
ncbi:hypothetical protein BYT27DRAFT_7333767 [Phlegmacium glaucopus]|nr:hypothetical protein BYT27DRAFT_7333767 [Phlegmacium glaucopus]